MTGKPARILIIAGSDSSGGAGIQADIKTATALGAYAMTAVTAVTVQDTQSVHAVHLVTAETVRDQMLVCLDDIGADAIKTGMLGSAEIVEVVAETLSRRAKGIPLVVDPVLASTSGTEFLDDSGVATIVDRLLPQATLVTPNAREFEKLCAVASRSAPSNSSRSKSLDLRGASVLWEGLSPERARALANVAQQSLLIESEQAASFLSGLRAVLVTGGDSSTDVVVDTLIEPIEGDVWHPRYLVAPRLDTRHTHGTGCTLSTAIACGLSTGMVVSEAVLRARAFVREAIRTAPGFGSGHGPLNHMHGHQKPS